ncbi:unnamed protein product [Closterium sp. NIES-53]
MRPFHLSSYVNGTLIGVVAAAIMAVAWYALRGAFRSSACCPYVIRTADWAGQSCGTVGHTQTRCFSCLSNTWHAEFADTAELPRWLELLRQGVDVFALDYDAITTSMYALTIGTEGDCSQCILPDPCIEAAALGASESALPGTAPAKALHTFTLDLGASCCFFCVTTTLTPLSPPIPVKLTHASQGPVVARSSTVLPCSAIPSGSLSGLHLPSFSTNLVSTAALQDAMVTTTTPGGQRVSICSCTRSGRHLATFTRQPGSSLYTLTTKPPQTLLWHHRLGHPSLPCLRGMHSCLLVSGLPRSLPPLQPSPAPPCLPCVEGRQRAAPHSSSSPPMTAPLQIIQIDVWGPAHVSGQGRERYFLLVADDYTRYTTVILCTARVRGGEFSSDLLREFYRVDGILQSFTLPASPQQDGIAERRIGLVMEVAHTSMIHAAAPHFLWPFAVRYAAHQLNLWPCVSLPETLPTLCWTGKFYHPTLRRVFPSQDVTFDKSGPFYSLFPYRSAPPPPPPLFLALDPLPGTVPIEVAVSSSAARGAASVGAESESAESGGAEPGESEPAGVEPRGAESEGAESGGAEPRGSASSGGHADASPRLSPRLEPLSPQPLRKWFAQRTRHRSGAAEAGDPTAGDTGAGGAGVTAGACGTGGAAAAGPGGAQAGDTAEPRGAGAGGTGAGGVGAGGPGAGDPGAVGTGAGGTGAGGAGDGGVGAGGAVSGGNGARGTVRPRPYFVPLLQQVLGLSSSTGLTPPLLCPPPLQPASLLPAPSPYTEQTGGLTERREPESRHALPVCAVCTVRRVPCPRPPPVPGTNTMALCPSSIPLRVPLQTPPESSLPAVPNPESNLAHAASPIVSRLLATVVTDPSFESTAVFALVAELVDFAAVYRLDYATALVAESECASPPSVGGEFSLGTNVLENMQDDFECLAAVVPRFASMLLAHEGDPDAPDIPTPRSYAKAITGPYSSLWQAAMDAEMASWKSTCTYVDAVPPSRANIVDGM